MDSIFNQNLLFQGLSPQEIPAALHFLHAHSHQYIKGAMLQNIGQPFLNAGIVVNGQIEESCIIENFNQISLAHFFAGDLYGVPFVIEQINSPVQLVAQSACEVMELDLTALFNNQESIPTLACRLLSNLTRYLAHQDIHDIIRLHIASQKNIHDKLIVYLRHLPQTPNGYHVIPFS